MSKPFKWWVSWYIKTAKKTITEYFRKSVDTSWKGIKVHHTTYPLEKKIYLNLSQKEKFGLLNEQYCKENLILLKRHEN